MLPRSASARFDIWPGFVDVLAAILMVFVFLLMIFVLSYGQATDELLGTNRAIALLHNRINKLADQLSLARDDATEQERVEGALRASIISLQAEATSLQTNLAQRNAELESTRNEIQAGLAAQAALSDNLESTRIGLRRAEEDRTKVEAERETLAGRLSASTEELAASREEVLQLLERITLADRNVRQLNVQLAAIQALLAVKEENFEEQLRQFSGIGGKLNIALAKEVQELQKARSAFFGRLREIIGNRPDIKVEGDRFIFQSEVLFDTASAELGAKGKFELAAIAGTILELSQELPRDIDWVIQIQGHSDQRPIQTSTFPSNWELAAARALAVTRHFIQLGIPAERLAATSYAQTRPIVKGNNDQAWRQNRRIEIKIQTP